MSRMFRVRLVLDHCGLALDGGLAQPGKWDWPRRFARGPSWSREALYLSGFRSFSVP